jgi:hypothetical protein
VEVAVEYTAKEEHAQPQKKTIRLTRCRTVDGAERKSVIVTIRVLEKAVQCLPSSIFVHRAYMWRLSTIEVDSSYVHILIFQNKKSGLKRKTCTYS